MLARPAPTSQKADARLISFILNGGASFGDPVTLPIRPEDLTRSESTRVAVHQTLGRETVGWADHFGENLPTVTIAGHTGWGYKPGLGVDGFQAFERLNKLVQHDYSALKQTAIDQGRDPAEVKLIFVDMLDNFAWEVAPTQFVLRRNKSRPLLFQYNIVLQALATEVDRPMVELPYLGSVTGGLGALGGALGLLDRVALSVEAWVNAAVIYVGNVTAPVAATVKSFLGASQRVFRHAKTIVGTVQNGFTNAANNVIAIANDMAGIGVNVFRTISTIAGLPSNLRADLARVGAAFNEVACIFRNSLRPRKTYDDFEGLYGASNCSSTTGGRAASAYLERNTFATMQPEPGGLALSSSAFASSANLRLADPVLAPMPVAEIQRHLSAVIRGITFPVGV